MAIQQHPLPQDITNYRFRLIGDMTIKQFASLAISIIVAIIVYGLPLPFFFRYPLTFFFVLLGVGMAFVPFQGRTLDIWIIAFIKSIYSPTLFAWKKTSVEDINSDTIATTESNLNALAPLVSNASIEINKGTPTNNPSSPPQTIPTPAQPILTTTVSETVAPIKNDHPKTEIITESISPTPLTSPTPPISTQPTTIISPASNLPIPFTPTTTNTLVGLTINKDSHIIDGVLVEIKKNNLTIRATKSNKLGQFMFARPLENGTYQILAEKEGNTFTTYSLELTGEIIRPLKIQAQL